MKSHRLLAAAACVAALAACQQETTSTAPPAAEATTEQAEREPRPIPANCAVTDQRDWEAQFSPGDSPTLTITGEIDLPTPGYSVSLARTPAAGEEEHEATLTLNLTPPTGVVAQVVTPTPVRYFGPAATGLRRVHIVCGDGVLRTLRAKRPD